MGVGRVVKVLPHHHHSRHHQILKIKAKDAKQTSSAHWSHDGGRDLSNCACSAASLPVFQKQLKAELFCSFLCYCYLSID